MPVEIGIECHRLEALMDAVVEFTPEPTSEMVSLLDHQSSLFR